jgi:tetratricopeptide (TPR) repeat protein
VRNNIGYTLGSDVPNAATMLRSAGYATGAAVSAYVMRRSTGIATGFDSWDDSVTTQPGASHGAMQRAGDATVDASIAWLTANAAKPQFFLLHLFEPHSPYLPPEPFRSRYASAYDGEVASADALVGRFLGELKSRGLYDRALIIFLSDHGEGLLDHGEPEHGIFLYRETARVPLVVKLPANERAGSTVREPAGLVDVLPTIAAVTGVAPPSGLDGISLLGTLSPGRLIYAETLYPRIHLGASELRSLAGARHHYIEAPRPELFDMVADPGENKNVLGDERRVYAAMRKALDQYPKTAALPTRLDPEEARKLAALGYLGGMQAAGDGPLPDPKDRIGEVAALARANEQLRSGETWAAIAALRTIVAGNPRFSDAWNQLATTLEKEGRFGEAADAYASAIRNIPDVAAEFALPLGTIYLRLGRLDEADAHARLAETHFPGRAQMLHALVALARRDIAGAEQSARRARNDPATAIDASVFLAGLLAERGDLQESLRLLEEAETRARVSNAGPQPTLAAIKAGVLMRMGRRAEAEQILATMER